MNSIKSAFTLVELLVVITIVSILTTIWALYLFDSFWNSRDSARKSSFEIMGTNLELYYSEESHYPMPDDSLDIVYNWWVAWSQWVFGLEVGKKIRNFGQDIPQDPLFQNYYSYSVTNNESEYQIAALLEGLEEDSDVWSLSLISNTNAAIETAFVQWNYNEVMLRVKEESWDYTFIAAPSIIASNLSSTWVTDIITGQKLVYDEFFNLPASYSGYLDTDNGFNFNVSDPIIFSWSLNDLRTQDGMNNFLEKLQYIYSVTPTESFDRYISFIEKDGISKIKTFLEKNFKVSFSYAFNCQDLFDQWIALEDGTYEIDSDGSWPLWKETVYCDIRNDTSAWTRIWDNYLWINGWDFISSNHVSTNYYTLYPSAPENTIVPMVNPGESWNVLHQTWWNTSNYEVHFNDFSNVKVWDEIKMGLWVSWNTWAWSNSLNINPNAWYMFHNRIYYIDGTFSSNGTSKLLESKEEWGRNWTYLENFHKVRKEPQSFSWFIWLDSQDIKDIYITWIDLELYRH